MNFFEPLYGNIQKKSEKVAKAEGVASYRDKAGQEKGALNLPYL